MLQAEENSEGLLKELTKWKRIAFGLGATLLIIIVGSSSFYAGRKTAITDTDDLATPMNTDSDVLSIIDNDAPDSVTPSSAPTPTKSKNSSSTPTPILSTKLKVLKTDPQLDGFRSSNASGSTTSNIRTGRDSELVTRGFVSFDISDLGNDVVISSATLRLYQTKTLGEPYSQGGSLYLDHLTYGNRLDKNDYSSPALTSNFTIFSESAKRGWVESDIKKALADDLSNARALSQFRLHFEREKTGGTGEGDFAYFESTENTQKTGNVPELVVEYSLEE